MLVLLPHPGLEQIIETYYSHALSPSTKVSLDYQFIANPAYNTDRGPMKFLRGGSTRSFRPTRAAYGARSDRLKPLGRPKRLISVPRTTGRCRVTSSDAG
jgi:Carbohydrate-selective porin, OprB family